MARALQITTRAAPIRTGAPPARAAVAPSRASDSSAASMTPVTRWASGISSTLTRGRAAPTENAAAEEPAASSGRARVFWSFSAIQIPRGAGPELVDRVQRFRARVNEVGARSRIQGGPIALDDGQFLIIDDHRFFHGRDPLPEGSRRHLFRCYLALHDPCLRTAELELLQ